jgi:hypothetical protein
VSDHPDECGCVECLRAESYRLGEAYRLRLPPDPRKVLLAQLAASICDLEAFIAELTNKLDVAEQDRNAERAAIVAWLRGSSMECDEAADAIEAGEHLKERG